MLGFNPRPPSMAGDPVSPHGQHQPGAVSIRARHRWRAILACVIRGDFRCKFQSAPAIDGGRSGVSPNVQADKGGFNPRPPSMAGDPFSGFFGKPLLMFQSAPAIDGGRSWAICCTGTPPPSFNPRPPSMAGDPPPPAHYPEDAFEFQSAPAIDGGRSANHQRKAPCARCFNPRPPSMAGDPAGAGDGVE